MCEAMDNKFIIMVYLAHPSRAWGMLGSRYFLVAWMHRVEGVMELEIERPTMMGFLCLANGGFSGLASIYLLARHVGSLGTLNRCSINPLVP
jgi:hypothetical protein